MVGVSSSGGLTGVLRIKWEGQKPRGAGQSSEFGGLTREGPQGEEGACLDTEGSGNL